MSKKHKKKPTNIEKGSDNKYVSISSNELKKLIIAAIKEEKAKEDDSSSSNLSQFTQMFVIFVYFIFYCAFTTIIYDSFSTGSIPKDEIFQVIFYIALDFLTIALGYFMAKNKSKSDISQHFTVLTTIIALSIAFFVS